MPVDQKRKQVYSFIQYCAKGYIGGSQTPVEADRSQL